MEEKRLVHTEECIVYRLTVGMYLSNCYIVQPAGSERALVIDPGDEAERIQEFLRARQIQPEKIVLTHGHIDHIGGCAFLQDTYQIPVLVHSADKVFVENATIISGLMGMKRVRPPRVDGVLADEGEITIGGMTGKVLHTPGHSPGSICLLFDDLLFSGDTLFQGSVGRADLPGGQWHTLLHSLRTRLLTLADDIRVFPGHGEETTIGQERRFNPFLHMG